MTGRPNFALMSRTRAVVSLPCNCSRSGRRVSTIFSSVASSASTVSATLAARPLACLPSSRAVSRLRCRGDGGKNTKPTMSAPAPSATSSVSRVDRPQILTSRDMVSQGADFEPPNAGWNGADGAGSTTSRPACLARRPRKYRAGRGAGSRCWSTRETAAAARKSAVSARARRASASCWRAARRQWRCRNQVAMPPAATPRIATSNDHDEQRQRHRDRRIGRN